MTMGDISETSLKCKPGVLLSSHIHTHAAGRASLSLAHPTSSPLSRNIRVLLLGFFFSVHFFLIHSCWCVRPQQHDDLRKRWGVCYDLERLVMMNNRGRFYTAHRSATTSSYLLVTYDTSYTYIYIHTTVQHVCTCMKYRQQQQYEAID